MYRCIQEAFLCAQTFYPIRNTWQNKRNCVIIVISQLFRANLGGVYPPYRGRVFFDLDKIVPGFEQLPLSKIQIG